MHHDSKIDHILMWSNVYIFHGVIYTYMFKPEPGRKIGDFYD